MANENTVLVKHVYTGSTCRMPVERYNQAVADAEDIGQECPWAKADEDGQDSPTFDDLPPAEQKKVKEAQAERQARIDAKAKAE